MTRRLGCQVRLPGAILFLLWLSLSQVRGGEPDAPASAPQGAAAALQELKLRHQLRQGSEERALLEKYRQALIKLERSLVQERDYRAAIPVRNERRQMEERLMSLQPPGEAPTQPYPGGPITLTAETAETSGGVFHDPDKGALAGWTRPTARAQWKLSAPLSAGGYEVILEMACAPGSGGQVTVREDFHTLTRKVQPTAGWESFESQSLGTIRIRHNATGLDLQALTVEGDGLFLLRCVKLVPIASESP